MSRSAAGAVDVGDDRRGRARPAVAAGPLLVERDILAAGPSSIMSTGVTLTVASGEIPHQTEEVA